jgi:hypothetical protein
MDFLTLIRSTLESLGETQQAKALDTEETLNEEATAWLTAFQAATVSIKDFEYAISVLKKSKTKTISSDAIIIEVKKERGLIKEYVTQSFKGWTAQFPAVFGKDVEKITQKIMLWISEMAIQGVSSKEYLEIREQLAKDSKFVTKPPEIEDFFNVRKQFQIFEEYSGSEQGTSIVDATKRLSKTFDHRYSFRWSKVDMNESNDRIEAWIKHFNMFNLTAESIDKAVEMAGKMSDFNKFPPSMQDFTVICKLAMCGDDIPGPHEAYLIASGLVRNKVAHPLITYAASQVGEYELRNGKINKDAFISVYQNAILDYSASGELPIVSKQIETASEVDNTGPASKDHIVNLIDQLLEEVNDDEQYY